MLEKNNFKSTYNSKTDNIINDFYIPAMKSSIKYDRISAYFDSKILRMYSAGLENLIANNGKIRFIFSCQIEEQDYVQMKKGYELRDKYKSELLNSINDEDLNADLSNLAYLISQDIVDIKIAFTKSGIFHDKYGLFYDGKGNVLYFRGSNNETTAAVLNNYESFETSISCNCDNNELKKIDNAVKSFENLWNDNVNGVIVLPLPTCVLDKILTYSQNSMQYIYQIKENAVIFDYDNRENRAFIINNLDFKDFLSPDNMFYKYKLSAYVELIQNDRLFLKKLSYVIINNLINTFKELSRNFGFEIYVTPFLREYLYDKDIEIDKRKSLGIAIKHRENIVEPSFEKFKMIVDMELERKLRDAQLWDAFHMVSMRKSANFSVPGAGKTSIVYGAFAYLNYYKLVDKIVMIGPKNSFSSWKKEFYKNFGTKRTLSCLDIQDDEIIDKRTALKHNSSNKNLILINYESVPNLVRTIIPILNDKTLLVFDEVHRIKGINRKRAEACLELSQYASYKVALTGTPIPNSYADIYNLLHLLYGEEYDTFFDFKVNQLATASKDSDLISQINHTIYPFFCRTTKRDLSVPEPYDDDVETGYLLMNEEEERIMQIVYNTFGKNILLLYIRLLQASSNPSLLLENIDISDLGLCSDDEDDEEFNITGLLDNTITMSQEDYDFIKQYGYHRKIDYAADIICDIVNKGESVIAWGMFVKNLFLLHYILKSMGIRSVVVSGQMPLSEREKAISLFESGYYKVLITNPHTLAESISLHKVCHYALYFEYSFNLTHMLQSRDRIHRLGITEEERPHYIYMFLDNNGMYNSIDRKVYYRLKEKEKIMIDAVENAEILYYEDNYLDDIKYILEKD